MTLRGQNNYFEELPSVHKHYVVKNSFFFFFFFIFNSSESSAHV